MFEEKTFEGQLAETINLLENKISDLEAKLAESEKKLNQYPYKNDVIEDQYEDLKDAITFLMLNNIKDQEQLNHSIDVLCEKHKARIRDIEQSICSIEQLKQQLAEKNADLHQIYSHLGVEAFCEDIHEQALKEIGRLQEQLAEKEKEIMELSSKVDLFESEKENLFRTLEEANEDYQDKISFCIEKLEKVKEFFLEEHRDEEMDTDYIITKNAGEIADYLLDQIEQLKKGL